MTRIDENTPMSELRARWEKLYGNPPPPRASREILTLASELGLKPDESGHSATGTLDGLPFSLGLRTVRRSKSQSVQFWASLNVGELPKIWN